MTTHVKDTSSASGTLNPGNTAGNNLLLFISCINNSPSDVANIASITDSAGNTYRYSTATLNALPPVSGAVDTTNNAYFFSAMACCLNIDNGGSVAAATSITVTFNHGPTHSTRLLVSEFSGMPASSVPNAANTDNTFSANAGGSYTIPVVPTAPQGIIGGVTVSDNGFTGTSAPFTFYNANGGDQGWDIFSGAGTYNLTFTAGGANGTASAAIMAIGPPAVPVVAGQPLPTTRVPRRRLARAVVLFSPVTTVNAAPVTGIAGTVPALMVNQTRRVTRRDGRVIRH
jgi:hypothetical protein